MPQKNICANKLFKIDVEANVLDIISTSRKKIGGKGVPVNIPNETLENMSFHSE